MATIAAKVPDAFKRAIEDLAHQRRTTVSAIIIESVQRTIKENEL